MIDITTGIQDGSVIMLPNIEDSASFEWGGNFIDILPFFIIYHLPKGVLAKGYIDYPTRFPNTLRNYFHQQLLPLMVSCVHYVIYLVRFLHFHQT